MRLPILGLFTRGPDPSFSVIATQRAPRAPGGVRLQKPVVDDPGGAALPAGSAEIVVTVFDAAGTALSRSGWFRQARSFHDTIVPKKGRIRGGPRRPKSDDRKFFIPIPDNGQFVILHRATVAPGGAIQRVLLAAFTLQRVSGTPLPPVPVFSSGVGAALVVPEVVEFADPSPPAPVLQPATPAPSGQLLGRVSLPTNGPSGIRFDVVVMGDGYGAADIARFDTESAGLIAGLRAMQPFKAHDANVNYHTIRLQSTDTGITDAAAGPKHTYLHVRTDPDDDGSVEVLGTRYPDLIQQTASTIAPWSQLDLVIVLVNLGPTLVTKPYFRYGSGHAYPDLRVVFGSPGDPGTMTSQQILRSLVQTVAHEVGHAIAFLAEEYISCVSYDPTETYPNFATQAQVVGHTAPWTTLALPTELTATGDFKVMHVYGQLWDSTNNENQVPPADRKKLGAFWGCQCTSPGKPVGECNFWNDTDGGNFFRPMLRCRMRDPRRAFCRACNDAIGRGLVV